MRNISKKVGFKRSDLIDLHFSWNRKDEVSSGFKGKMIKFMDSAKRLIKRIRGIIFYETLKSILLVSDFSLLKPSVQPVPGHES
jgi:hypothetical protein